MKRRAERPRVEINLDELDGILDRSTTALLSKAESQKLKAALHALADRFVQKRSSEKMKSVFPEGAPQAGPPSADDKVAAACGHGRNGAAAFAGAIRVSIPHATLQPGHACLECGQGKVYRQKDPATLVRIVGRAPLQTTVFEMDRLRCNACGQVFTAVAPEAAGGDKYDATAVAMIALLKYGTGVPFKRLEKLEGQLAMPLPAATQWELMAATAKLLWYVLEELIRQAAQGSILHNDDTGMRVLRIIREAGDKRTGIFTSGIVALVGIHKIALFFTGTKHAGENIVEVLKRRAQELPAPIQMCDALARNAPKPPGVRTLLANCLAHGRRQIVEVAENFPEQCRYVLEILGGVYRDLFMSLIHTCELNGANPFHYLTELLRHAEELTQKPSLWMPWNYRETLARRPSAA